MTEKIITAKKELNALSNIEGYMRRLKEQRDTLWSRFTAIRITNYETIGGRSSSDQEAKIAATVDKLWKIDDELAKKLYEAEELKEKLLEKINKLPQPYSEILMRRYIDHEKYEKIALDLSYSYYYVVKRAIPLAIKKYSEI